MGVCSCSMFCCALLCVHFSIAIILMGKRELIALLNLSSWCLVMVERLFLTVPRGCLQFVIVVFPDHTHLLFLQKSRLGLLKVTTRSPCCPWSKLAVTEFIADCFSKVSLISTKKCSCVFTNLWYDHVSSMLQQYDLQCTKMTQWYLKVYKGELPEW